jgi:hypothetical protein
MPQWRAEGALLPLSTLDGSRSFPIVAKFDSRLFGVMDGVNPSCRLVWRKMCLKSPVKLFGVFYIFKLSWQINHVN